MKTLAQLRTHAVTHSLFRVGSLKIAFKRLGFVQADPIRSPARAQDLILRHRVEGYQAGDLDRRYAKLEIEEDYLYAYGFVHRDVWALLHPRQGPDLTELENKVYATVCRIGHTHPAALEMHFGRARVINAWGGYSKATTHALEHLHDRGLLRIAHRENGVRVYVPSKPCGERPPADRLRGLILTIVNILAPIPIQTLHSKAARYKALGNPRDVVRTLTDEGVLQTATVDGLQYLWRSGKTPPEQAPRVVRFLAPFDPVVWDRRRFEHLWGWPYRFEAYTPPSKRIRGYYAMPLLWGNEVVGWANAAVLHHELQVEVGFVKRRPAGAEFSRELDEEIFRLKTFLGKLH